MGRPRGFDEPTVTAAAAGLFRTSGYEGTSIDDLVAVSGLHRGSLYKAFGSKRGIFVSALQHVLRDELPAATEDLSGIIDENTLDLVLVAALELAPRDPEVRGLVEQACALIARADGEAEATDPATVLGRRLLHRAGANVIPPEGER